MADEPGGEAVVFRAGADRAEQSFRTAHRYVQRGLVGSCHQLGKAPCERFRIGSGGNGYELYARFSAISFSTSTSGKARPGVKK